jgi:Ca2+/Na+ antiporter
MGLALVLVGMMMIYASRDLVNRKGIPLLNAIIRLVFAVFLIYYLAKGQLPWILTMLGVIDISISMNLFYYLHKAGSRQGDHFKEELEEGI